MEHSWFVYEDMEREPVTVIRVRAKRKPGPNTIPKNGAWRLQVWTPHIYRDGFYTESGYHWEMPCFPEITWGTLSKYRFARKESVLQHEYRDTNAK